MCLNVSTNVGDVRPQVVHGIDVGAGGAGGANLAEVLLGFTKEFLGFMVVCGVFAFFGKGLEVRDKVE